MRDLEPRAAQAAADRAAHEPDPHHSLSTLLVNLLPDGPQLALVVCCYSLTVHLYVMVTLKPWVIGVPCRLAANRESRFYIHRQATVAIVSKALERRSCV